MSGYAASLGYPNSGTGIRMDALRPDGTYIDILCANLPCTEGGAGSVPVIRPTRPQPPLSTADLLKLATVITY